MEMDSNEKHALVRGLGLAAAGSVIIGNVIGTGVFLKARVMTCNVGEPFWVIMAWVAAGLLSLAGALTYAELTAMKPEAGAGKSPTKSPASLGAFSMAVVTSRSSRSGLYPKPSEPVEGIAAGQIKELLTTRRNAM